MKLQGIRVIDLSSFLPGPYLTLAMADHGAEVIKVEAPGGDHGRSIGSLDGDSTVFFRNVNRGKKKYRPRSQARQRPGNIAQVMRNGRRLR